MSRPTLHDVAREAGVSHMTVSRVLNGSRVVASSTAERVRAALAKLGYRPDPALSALASYRKKGGGRGDGSVLVCIDCDGTDYSRTVFNGVREEAALLGYGCEVVRLPDGEKRQATLSRNLFHRGVQGMLFGPSEERQTFAGWRWDTFAAVSLGALSHRPAMHTVSLDYFHGAKSACEQLRESGCRRVGMVIDPHLEGRTGGLWLGGYAAGVLSQHRPLVCPREDIRGETALPRWLRANKIDGVVTIHGDVARRCHALGIPPVFLNMDNPDAAFPHYGLPNADIGREGVRLLHHALLRHEFGLPGEPKHVALRGTWRSATV